eukprot:1485324-Prorocentrum_lima.AAC.1
MTSSLVGSEMCIRDRCRADIVLDIVLLPALPETFTCYSTITLSYNPWSVSYTHLTLPTICSV